jgi:3-hydroxyacyl-[acyl-carrier-protein] dehydratase
LRFLLIDEIQELNPGLYIRAVKTMPPDEELFKDHFPGFPVVPGVLLIEMMAQAAGKCLAAEDSKRGRPMLAKVTSASFREWVKPGQISIIDARIRSSRAQFATAECCVEVDGQTVAESSLLFAFKPQDQFAPDYHDDVLDRFLNKSSPQHYK